MDWGRVLWIPCQGGSDMRRAATTTTGLGSAGLRWAECSKDKYKPRNHCSSTSGHMQQLRSGSSPGEFILAIALRLDFR